MGNTVRIGFMKPRSYLSLALLCPPLAVALVQPKQLLLNLPLTLAGWLPGSVHALILVYHWCEENDPLALAGCMQDD